MPVAICPHCGTEQDVDFADCGQAVECTECHAAFTMPLPVIRPVKRLLPKRRRRNRDVIDEHSSPKDLILHAKSECRNAADGLFILGALAVFFGSVYAVAAGIAVFGGPDCEPYTFVTPNELAIFYFGYGLYALLIGAFQCYAARQMLQAKQYSICVVACVVSLIPGFAPCYLTLFFGVMGLMKLRDPWVRKGFAANRPGYDPDAPA